MKLKATLLYFDELNLNNRIYRKKNLIPHINDFKNRIKTMGCVYGQVGYPDTFDTSLSNASHAIKNIYIKNNKLIGEIEILNTYNGKEIKQLFNNLLKLKKLSIIDKIKYYRCLKINKMIDLDYVDLPFVFRSSMIGYPNNIVDKIKYKRTQKLINIINNHKDTSIININTEEINEVVITKILTFNIINKEEDSFKNITDKYDLH